MRLFAISVLGTRPTISKCHDWPLLFQNRNFLMEQIAFQNYSLVSSYVSHVFWLNFKLIGLKYVSQDCIPVGCVPPASVDRISQHALRWEALCSRRCLLWGVCSRGCLLWGGVCIQWGLPNPGESVSRGRVSIQEGSASGGVCSNAGGSASRGVSVIGACWVTTDRPPWSRHPPVNRITDACENITLPQLRCGR